MKQLPLIIGEAPNRSGGSDVLASGRLRKFDIAQFERVNLLDEWPGPKGVGPALQGSAFPIDRARVAAQRLNYRTQWSRPFVLVGTRVAAAFGLKRHDYEFLTWYGRPVFGIGREVAVIPHPSGLNRWWNEPENVEAARMFFARTIAPNEPRRNEVVSPKQFPCGGFRTGDVVDIDAINRYAEGVGWSCRFRSSVVGPVIYYPEALATFNRHFGSNQPTPT